jgi:hypothetical protein
MDQIRALIGCHWGAAIHTAEDPDECPERAVQIVVLHDGPGEAAFRLCQRHLDFVQTQTTPRPELENHD